MISLIKRHIPNWLRIKLQVIVMKLNVILATIKVFFSLPLKRKHKITYLEIHIADHCNLNCAGCSHFSPLAKHELVSVEEFRRDFERLGEILKHSCNEIHLLGGEPLLHPDIITLMKIARKNFTHGRILIVTNGILLAQKEENFWQECNNNNIIISITHYPIKLEEEKIRSLAKKFDVKFEWYASNDSKSFFSKMPIDLSGKGSIARNFAACHIANLCVQLSHGRLYCCPFIPYVHFFSEYFSQDIDITEEDSIDIYQEGLNEDAILQRLSKPFSACRYCKISKMTWGLQWKISEKKISEWT